MKDMSTGSEQVMSSSLVEPVTTKMDLKPANNEPVRQQSKSEPQIVDIKNNLGTEGLITATIPTVAMPTNQEKAVNNLRPTDSTNEEAVIKSSTNEDVKSNQQAKAFDNEAYPQQNQDKQEFNSKNIEKVVQTEKTSSSDPQIPSVDGEKAVPPVGSDTTLSNKIVGSKIDVPAITKPLSHPEWSKELSERVVWMSNRAIPSAEIKLNPLQLGPISVRVDVVDDKTTVVFTAQHAATREAIEASIPKLREMMTTQQLNLADVNVSEGSSSDQKYSQTTTGGRGQSAGRQGQGALVEGIDDLEQEIEIGRPTTNKGLLNTYA